MKISELAEKLGISSDQLLADLEIEGAGKFHDIVTRAGRSQELEMALESKHQALAAYESQIQQLQQQATTEYQQTGQVPAWYNDELLRPIADSFKQLRDEVDDLQQKKIGVLANTLQQFIQQAVTWANQQEVRHLKQENSDFDEDRVRNYAQRHGINSWQAAYEAEKATRLPDIIKEEVEKARREGQAQGMAGAPIQTEMGSLNPQPLPSAKADYSSAWTSLLNDFQTLGHGSS
jgi:hypothetical protein